MSRRCAVAWCALLTLVGSLSAFEAVGTIKKIDVEKGVLIIQAKDQERTVKVDKAVKVLDAKGNELADGLKAKELKEGVEATFTVERENNEPVIKVIRLGKRQAEPPATGKKSVGFKPLTEMTAQDRYQGEDGGLYGGGKNEPPEAHLAAARKESAKVVPLDAAGKPAKDGKIVLISISMSNATQEFSAFKRIADTDPEKSPLLTIVDCAQGGQAMAEWAPPQARPWDEAERRLTQAGVTPKQVQVAWIKLANKGPSGELAEHGKKLHKDTVAVIHNARTRFPNLRLVYLGSRIYAGYAVGRLNPEPYAYESAFVARALIQQQVKGGDELNYDAERGKVNAPLLLWGPYFWADGTTPRKPDELIWERKDFADDGVHPSDSGRKKVADMLLKFFKSDSLAKPWFVKASSEK